MSVDASVSATLERGRPVTSAGLQGVAADVYDAAFLKPYDVEAIVDTARGTGAVVTIEDHSVVGGLGSIVAETLGRAGISASLDHVALPDEDLEVGAPADLYEYYEITAAAVVAKALALTDQA
jgi:transketolase